MSVCRACWNSSAVWLPFGSFMFLSADSTSALAVWVALSWSTAFLSIVCRSCCGHDGAKMAFFLSVLRLGEGLSPTNTGRSSVQSFVARVVVAMSPIVRLAVVGVTCSYVAVDVVVLMMVPR